MKELFEQARKIVFNRKLSLGLANSAVIHSWESLPEPINECPCCGNAISKKSFWQWFRSYYNSDGCDLKKEESAVSIRSSLMYAAISNKCFSCDNVVRTRDTVKGIERFDKKKAYKSIFSKRLV